MPISPRSTRRSAGCRSGEFLLVSAKANDAGAVQDALGDVVPARAADQGSGRDADEGRAAARGGARRPRRAGRGRAAQRPPRPLRLRSPVAARHRSRRPSRRGSRSGISTWPHPGRRRSVRSRAGRSCRAFLAARVSLRFDDTRPRSTSGRSTRRSTDRSTTGSTWTRRSSSTTTTVISRPGAGRCDLFAADGADR